MAAFHAGIPLEDAEFVQFHPSGLYRQGILFSEAARSEGGYLSTEKANASWRYTLRRVWNWHRVISYRAPEQSEIDAGRGLNGEDCYIKLDLRHLGEKAANHGAVAADQAVGNRFHWR